MAQTIGFGDLEDQDNQTPQNGGSAYSSPSNAPGAGQAGTSSGNGASSAGGNYSNTGQSSGVAAGGAPSGGNTASAARPATYNQQNQGTGFTNFQNYLKANNPSQLQQTVASGLENQNQSVLGNLNNAQQQFNTQQNASQANTNANQQAVQSVLSNPDAFTNVNTSSAAVNAAANPTGAAPSQANLTQGNLFSQLLGGQYSGPTSLAGQTALNGQAQTAQSEAQNLNNTAGRQQVLQQLLGSPNYNTGEQNFDAALLGQGASPALNAAQTQANALNGIVNQAGAGAQAQGAEQTSNAQQYGQQVQNQFTNTVGNLNSQLQQQAGTAQANQNAAYQTLLSAANSGTLNQQQANLLGVTNGEQITTDDLANLQKFITANPLTATAQNVANTGNYATLDALQQLAGSNSPAAANSILSQYQGQQGQAGAFAAAPQAVANTTGINNMITTDTGAYNSAENAAQGTVNADQSFVNWGQGILNGGDYAALEQANPLLFAGTNNTQAGLDQEIQEAQAGNQNAAKDLGQDAWNNYLYNVYGNGPDAGNSRNLSEGWAQGQLQQAQAAYNKEVANLNSTYGGLSNFNVIPATPTVNALTQLAGAPQLVNSTVNADQQELGNQVTTGTNS
jgi:hypothetical protein